MADDKNSVTNELMFEILKQLQQGQATLIEGQRDMRQTMIAMREEIHAGRGDVLRLEKAVAALEADVDRIKVRLDLRDD